VAELPTDETTPVEPDDTIIVELPFPIGFDLYDIPEPASGLAQPTFAKREFSTQPADEAGAR
jgi:hypothetical protein